MPSTRKKKKARETLASRSRKLAAEVVMRSKGLLAGAILSRSVWELTPMQTPILAGIIVDGLTRGEAAVPWGVWRGEPAEFVRWGGVALAALAVIYGVSSYLSAIATARLSRRFVNTLRKRVARKVASLSLEDHWQIGAPELMNRVQRDCGSLRGFSEKVFIRSFTNILRTGYPAVALLLIDVELALLVFTVLPLQSWVSQRLQKPLAEATRDSLDRRTELTTTVKESLDGVESVLAAQAWPERLDKIASRADRGELAHLRLARIGASIRGSVWFLGALAIALLWWQGGLQVIAGGMTVGRLIEFVGLTRFLLRPFRYFSTIVKSYRRGFVVLERLQELLEREPAASSPSEPRPLPEGPGRLAASDLVILPGGRPASFTLEPGLTAIVGRCGSGKSTLLHYLAGLRRPSQGEVQLDGAAVSSLSQEDLRQSVVWLPQKPALFQGPLLDNLRLGQPGALRERVEEAVEAAGARAFVDSLADGLATALRAGGIRLSGGQTQHIALARALLRDPRVLLLDEPTAALDPEAEAALCITLRRLAESRTVAVVTHRPAVLKWTDRILVLDRGEIVGDGNVSTLPAISPDYHELFVASGGAEPSAASDENSPVSANGGRP